MNEIRNASEADNASKQKKSDTAIIEEISKAIAQVRHGEVTIIVQDSKVIQINKVEKRRFA
ncbi:MAG: YezD family protein [Nitrospirota bacterium]